MQATTAFGSFIYEEPILILAIISSTGPTVGGQTVEIIGLGFRYAPGVLIGGNALTDVVVVDSNHITGTTPAHAAGVVDVEINYSVGISTYAILPGGYTYFVAPPDIISIHPTQGAEAGFDSVIITGTGFAATPSVLFGGSAATDEVWIDANHVSCTTPAHGIGLVDVTLTNPDTQFDTLFSGYEYMALSPFVDNGGWWTSAEGFLGGSDVVGAPNNPKHPRVWAKLDPFVNATNMAEGGYPAASVIFRNKVIYAGDDYVAGFEQPTIRISDGISDRLMSRIPNTPLNAVPLAIVSMMIIDELIYVCTLDTGTNSTNYSGRVFIFDPIAESLTPISTAFTGGEVPYSLAWHMDRLWVGTNKGNGTPGKVYFFRPNIDTAWTMDYDLTGSTVGGALSMLSFNGLLYVGTDNAAGAFSKILVRSTVGAYTTAFTASGGTARVNNGFYSLIKYKDDLYATYWNNDTTPVAKVYTSVDGAAWTTSYTGSGLTLRPYMLAFLANKLLYVVGGGIGQRATMIRTPDGVTWNDYTAYLAGPVTETAQPSYGIIGF